MSRMRKSIVFIGLTAGATVLVALALHRVLGDNLEQPSSDTSYVCGRFGDKVMRIDRRYLFLSRVEYQDVDYWTPGNSKDHDSKGCDDQIQSAAFDVEWPTMTPSNSFRNLGKVDFVRFSLNQRSVWNTEKWGRSKDFFDETETLIHYSRKNRRVPESKRNLDDISSTKTFDPELDLYQIPGYDDEDSRMVVFWQETKEKIIFPVIRCVFYKKIDEPDCQYSIHVPNYGYNTSYIKIYFHADLLPHWKELRRDALQLIEHFTVKGKS